MDYKKIAKMIIRYSGGVENIEDGLHCITRVRLYLKDKTLADPEKLAEVDGVVGVQFKSGQYQIIVGNHVNEVFAEVEKLLSLNERTVGSKNGKIIDLLLDTIAQIFSPILPAIVGAGVMKGLLALFVAFQWVDGSGDTYQVLNVISDAAFYFLPFLLAASASRRFHLNEFIGMSLAGILMYPAILSAEQPLLFLGIVKIPVVPYAASVLPVILGVWLMSYVYRFVDKMLPKPLRLILAPVLTLMISVPVILAFIGPIGSYAGNYLAIVSNYLFANYPLVAGLLVGSIYPLIILTGMHYAYFPVLIQNLSTYGYDNGFFPISLFSNIAQAGAVFAVAVRSKSKGFKSMAISAGISALLGITEPALYGVNMKLRKPLYAAMISGGLVSCIALTLGVKYYGFVVPGLAALPVTMSPDGTLRNFIIAVLGVLASFLIAFFATLAMKIDDPAMQESETNEVTRQEEMPVSAKREDGIIYVGSPMSGKMIALSEVEDKTFSAEMVGKGFAVIPEEGYVYSPFDAEVTSVVNSGHAIGLRSDDGVEMLIHVGIDTVMLKENCFLTNIKKGDQVKKGSLLISFDIDKILSSKSSVVSPVVITNTSDYLDVMLTNENNAIQSQENVLALVRHMG